MSATQGTAVAEITQRILLIRGQRVMLDSDLAALYGVSTKRLNEQVKRNRARFPDAFMFRLTLKELAILRSQFATLKPDKALSVAVVHNSGGRNDVGDPPNGRANAHIHREGSCPCRLPPDRCGA